MPPKITVAATIAAPPAEVWRVWTTPADICQWNAASDDWHTPTARLDLRVGGAFCYRMEARDGSMGFDFEGTFTEVVPEQRLAFSFGDRLAEVDFVAEGGHTVVRETFDAEDIHSAELQRAGWQAILDRFARHVQVRRG